MFGKNLNVDFSIFLPIGISFFTFQALSYVIDIYRGKVDVQKNIFKLALYISFFPQLIAGPIVRYSDIEYELDNRSENLDNFYNGICRFVFGLSKKVLIADILAVTVDQIYALEIGELGMALSWLGALLYTLEIYFDFSGYSDMAIGMALMFGFHFNENFMMPYTADNITKFWKKWHISLSSFFLDYVYIPLGGNRNGKLRTYINLGIVFVLCGIWHGANWTFLIWGIYHGTLLIVERMLKNKYSFEMHGVCGRFLTFVFVMIGWVFFRAESIGQAVGYLKTMFGISQVDRFIYYPLKYYMTPQIIFVTVLAVVLAVVSFEGLKEKLFDSRWKGVLCIILLLISLIYMSNASFNAFIYFQF